jgi:transcriptional regulator with XRE-family HTH domain
MSKRIKAIVRGGGVDTTNAWRHRGRSWGLATIRNATSATNPSSSELRLDKIVIELTNSLRGGAKDAVIKTSELVGWQLGCQKPNFDVEFSGWAASNREKPCVEINKPNPSHIWRAPASRARARDIEFAKRLKRLMEEQELSQSDLAAEIWGRYTNTEDKFVARGRDRISVWVNGRNFPDKKNLEKLAKVLKVSVADLAPQALVKAAHHGAADWSFTRPHGDDDRVFVQIARFCSAQAAHEIQGILLRDEGEHTKGAAKKR